MRGFKRKNGAKKSKPQSLPFKKIFLSAYFYLVAVAEITPPISPITEQNNTSNISRNEKKAVLDTTEKIRLTTRE